MGKAGFIFHGARGKVGNQVLSKGERGTVQKEYVIPRNPKTTAQGKQRMSFAMATSAAAALKFIVNHSFENVSGEKENMREFVRVNSKKIRSNVESFMAGQGGFHGNAQIKGARTLQSYEYIVSRGSVIFPEFKGIRDDGSDSFGAQIPVADKQPLTATITTQEQYVNALAQLNMKPGDELTLVGIVDYPTVIATYDGETNTLCRVFAGRITFKTEIPEGFSGALLSSGIINASLIEEKYGVDIHAWEGSDEDENDYCQFIFAEDFGAGVPNAAGLIRSCKDMNGKCTYSNCTLDFFGEPESYAPTVLQSYLSQSGSNNSEAWLDQADPTTGV